MPVIINIDSYCDLAMRTNRWNQDPVRERITNDTIHLLHAAMGLSTEVKELFEATDSVNIMEECGDFLWYSALMCKVFGLELRDCINMADPQLPSGNPLNWLNQPVVIACCASEILDHVKKHIFYGRPIDRLEIAGRLALLLRSVERVLGDAGFTMDDAMARNIHKLRTRFPNCYTDESANNRDLQEERAVLEGGDVR